MAYLTREEILAKDDIGRDDVDVPEWAPEGQEEAKVLVRGLTAQQYIGMGFDLRGEGDTLNPEKAKEMMPMIVVMGVIDEEGNCLFSDKDVAALAKKSFAPIERISARILELSGMTAEGAEEKN